MLGNARYLFLWLRLYRPDIAAAWITEDDRTARLLTDAGYAAYQRWSLRGMWATMRSRVFVFCHSMSDINEHLSGGAYLLNLWHGVGIKAIMLGHKTGLMAHYSKYRRVPLAKLLFLDYFTQPDVVVTTSEFMRRHFAQQFQLPPERCPILGYSRMDACLDRKLSQSSIALDEQSGFTFPAGQFAEYYLYMPTWRDTARPFLDEALPDLARLSALLKARDAVLLLKLHPYTAAKFQSSFDNIIAWPSDVEVYSYLDRIDCLITDYSSILYDFLYISGKGIILYTFDLEEYVSTDRAMLYPFDENTVGLRVGDFETLCRAVEDGSGLREPPDASQLREKFWGEGTRLASPTIVDFVSQAIGGLPRSEERAS